MKTVQDGINRIKGEKSERRKPSQSIKLNLPLPRKDRLLADSPFNIYGDGSQPRGENKTRKKKPLG